MGRRNEAGKKEGFNKCKKAHLRKKKASKLAINEEVREDNTTFISGDNPLNYHHFIDCGMP